MSNTDFEGMTDEELESYFETADPKEQELILDMLRERESL